MAYDYYRSSVPGWGTSQFQFSAPPAPAFRPQPTWGGLDYYNAHALNPDPTLYNSVLSRMGQANGIGLGRREARYWHRRVYSGLSPLTQLLPTDIGAAAAYEAYRTWKHNPALYEPLGMDPVRVREGLIGMAIAETTRLWQYAGRPMDTYGLRAASEAAASVAAILAERLLSYTANEADIPPEIEAGYRARARSNSYNIPSVMRAGSGSPYLGAGLGGVPAGPPTMNPMGAGSPLPPSAIPGMAASTAGAGIPPPSPAHGRMAGGAAFSPTPMASGVGMPPGPMPIGVPPTGMGGGGLPPPLPGAFPPAGAYGTAMPGAGIVGGAALGGMGAYGGGAGGMPVGAGGMGGGQAAPPPTVIIERSSRRPRARRYSDSYTERPRRRSATIEVIPPTGGGPGYAVGGGYGGSGMYGSGAYGGAGPQLGAGNAYAAAMGREGYGTGLGGIASSVSGAGMASGTGPGGAPGPTPAAREEAVEEEAARRAPPRGVGFGARRWVGLDVGRSGGEWGGVERDWVWTRGGLLGVIGSMDVLPGWMSTPCDFYLGLSWPL
ncbi:hypothetical protein BN946_scf184788.g11 [Trametes cinnabarina]|uniref:Uncharacterized protein n=1 Tax=Pycnoporus cinnabarinus TaxID=5643 RepID=A0A060S1B9_PYCCI|nr:hypothetical protein BN946_scf184788.g11 [Trametes cinnabarina]